MLVPLLGFLIFVFSALALVAGIPEGTAFDVRQSGAISTRTSRVGDALRGVLLTPIVHDGKTIVPVGTPVEGTVERVVKFGFGIKHQTSSLNLRFHTLCLPNGERLPIETRLTGVDTAKEGVDADGRIHGISPSVNLSSSLAVVAWRLLLIAPQAGVPVALTKFLVARSPDPEISFPAGTEFRLELTAPVALPTEHTDSAPAPRLTEDESRELKKLVAALPEQQVRKKSGVASDLINVLIVGSSDQISRAFAAAGWTNSDRRSTRSVLKTYYALVERRGYRTAPMGTMTMNGEEQGLAFQKSLNSFSKRHHLRLWKQPEQWNGQDVWISAASEDVSIAFSKQARAVTHMIDENIDLERTKVVNDLFFTGCVGSAGLLEREDLPLEMDNGAGIRLITDGHVAAIRLSGCENPRLVSGLNPKRRAFSLARTLKSVGHDLFRSNLVYLGYQATRLSGPAKTLLTGKRENSGTPHAMVRQQADWLNPETRPGGGPQAGDDPALRGDSFQGVPPVLPYR